jgi:hypothetical protein
MISRFALSGWWANRGWLAVLGGLTVAGVVVGHGITAQLAADLVSPLAITTHLYAVLLVGGLIWLAAGVGSAALRWLGLPVVSRLEGWVFALALGFGIIAYAMLGLGLVGLLLLPSIVVALAVLALLARRDLVSALKVVPDLASTVWKIRRDVRSHGGALGIVVPSVEILFVVTLISALAPPIGYDALMYHLQAPKRFLELGRLAVLPDVQQANMPLTVDLLYVVGLALGSDEFANVLHLALALMVVGAIFSFGREFLDEKVGLLAALVFLSSPSVAMFAPMANIDYGLALFDFLAVYAFARWLRSDDRRFLLVSGVLVGFAMGSKYFGGITGLALGLLLVWTLARSSERRPPRQLVVLLLTFALPAALIAAPWYVKNALWLGSPIWPLLAPGPQAHNIAISANANLGRGVTDYLLLPWRVYFGAAHEYALARPSLLFVLLPLYLFVPKNRVVSGLLGLGAFHLVVWTQGPHVIRYFTSVTPELCLATAYVLSGLARVPRLQVRGRPLTDALLVLGVASTTTVALVMAIFTQPFGQLVGLESREAFLERNLPNHRLVAHLNRQGDAVRGVLLIGDRRAFYVDAPNWIDVSLGALEALGTAPDAAAARAYLDGLGVSHVLVSEADIEWHAQYDRERKVHGWWATFERMRPEYLSVEETYYGLAVYRVDNQPGVASSAAGP